MAEDDDSADQDRSQPAGSAGEYALGALGALLVVALLAYLGYQALAVRESGPEIAVEVTGVQSVAAGHAVRLAVRNHGGTTAEGVVISGHLTRDGRQVDQASTTVSYVPPDSMRAVTLVFSQDPRVGELVVGPDGYAPS